MNSLTLKPYIKYIPDFFYKVGWLGILIGLPLNKVVLSVGVMSLSLGTFLYFFTKKLQRPITLVGILLFSFFLSFAIALLWTSDLDYGLKQLRIYLPLLSIGVSLFYFDYFRTWEFKILWSALNITLSVVLFFNLRHYFIENPLDIRDISLFTSHIRLGLILFTVFVINLYWILKKHYVWIIPNIAFLSYLLFSQSLTALSLGLISGLIGAIVFIYQTRNRQLLITVTVILIGLFGIGTYLIKKHYTAYYTAPQIDWNNLPTHTKNGGLYKHIKEYKDIENNAFVFTYLCLEEVHNAWNQVSEIKINSNNDEKSPVFWTLIRYMTSKGLKKDAEGFKSLNSEDIQNIENGITNIRLVNASPIAQKTYELFYEYVQIKNGGDLMNTSVSSRLIYNKAGLKSERNFILGGGTGSIEELMTKSYQKNYPNIDRSLLQRPHNQWISILIEQGFLLCTLLLAFGLYLIFTRFSKSPIYGIIICLAFLSFFNDDTLTTQVGASYFSFALASYIFIQKTKDSKDF